MICLIVHVLTAGSFNPSSVSHGNANYSIPHHSITHQPLNRAQEWLIPSTARIAYLNQGFGLFLSIATLAVPCARSVGIVYFPAIVSPIANAPKNKK